MRGLFEVEMDRVMTTTTIHIEERERLMKAKLGEEIKLRANRIMTNYLINKSSLPEITDAEKKGKESESK